MLDQQVLQRFSNAEQEVLGRHFPGFRPRSDGTEFTIDPRSVRKLNLEKGDLLAINGHGAVAVAAFDESGNPRPSHLGLQDPVEIDAESFHAQPLLGWIEANVGVGGGTIQAGPILIWGHFRGSLHRRDFASTGPESYTPHRSGLT